MKTKKTYSLISLIAFLFWSATSFAQADSTGSTNTGSLEEMKANFVEGVGQFFDVRMLDHSIQTRGLVKKQGLKDSLKTFNDLTDGKLNIAIISTLNIDELWPNVLNRKKYYSVDGKFAVDTTEMLSNSDTSAYIIALSITVDTLQNQAQYGVQITGVVDNNITTFLASKDIHNLDDSINQYFVDYFTQHPGPWAKPNEAPVADAVMGLLAMLDEKFKPFYDELLMLQLVDGLVSETFEHADESYHVKFSATSNQNYGFDYFDMRWKKWVADYDFVRMGDGKIYKVNVKSTKKNFATETVKAILVDSAGKGGSITFKTKKGVNVPVQSPQTGNEYILELPAFSNNGKVIIYAYKGSDKLGKLTLEVYGGKSEKVVIVPVNCNLTLTDSMIANYLDMRYKAGVVDWDVEVKPTWTNNEWDSLGTPGKLESAETTLMSKYSTEMRALRDIYFDSQDSTDKHAYYIFVVNDFTNFNQAGYMVIGKSIGFVKKGTEGPTLKRLVAHELGHGAFGLRHKFDEIPQASSSRLMDYVSATHLCKREWNEIHSILPDWSRFDDEEEFAFAMLSSIQDLQQYSNGDFFTFMAPSGMPISIPTTIKSLTFHTYGDLIRKGNHYVQPPIGSLAGFVTDDGVGYHCFNNYTQSLTGDYYFNGYVVEQSGGTFGDKYIDIYHEQLRNQNTFNSANPAKTILGFACYSEEVLHIKPKVGSLTTAEINSKNLGSNNFNNYYAYGLVTFTEYYLTKDYAEIDTKPIISTVNTEALGHQQAIKSFLNYFNVYNSCEKELFEVVAGVYYLAKNQDLLECLPEIANIINPEKWYSSTEMTQFNKEKLSQLFLDENTFFVDLLGKTDLNPASGFISDLYNINKYSIAYSNNTAALTSTLNELDETSSLNSYINSLDKLNNNEASCVFKKIPFELRIKLLKDHNKTTLWSTNTFTTNKEELLTNLVEYIDQSEIERLMDELTKDDGKLFWELYNDIYSGGLNLRYAEAVSSHLIIISNYDQEKNRLKNATRPQSYITTDYIELYRTSTWDYISDILLTTSNPVVPIYEDNYDNDYSLEGGILEIEVNDDNGSLFEGQEYELIAHSFSFVKIVFRDDFKFTIKNVKINEGDEFILPAFMAYHFLRFQGDECAWTGARITAEVIGVVATFGAGSAALFTIECIASGVSISLELTADYVQSSTDVSQFWKDMHADATFWTGMAAIGLASPAIITSVGGAVGKVAYKIADKFEATLNSISAINKTTLKVKFDKFVAGFNNLGVDIANYSTNAKMAFTEKLVYAKFYINSLIKIDFKSATSPFSVSQSGNLFVNNIHIGKVELDLATDGFYVVLGDNITYLDDLFDETNLTPLFELPTTKIQKGNDVMSGNFRVFRQANGAIVFKLADAGGGFDNLFPLIKNHPDFQGFRSLCINNNKITVNLTDASWDTYVNGVRNTYGISDSRNIAKFTFDGNDYLIVSGKKYSNQMTNSTEFIPKSFVLDIESGQRIFTPSMPTRHLDTESLALEYFAKQKNAVAGSTYPNITGEIKITSDLCPCPSCSSIFQQFSTMFPSVDIKITTSNKLHY